jgi:hypothetical protein
MDRRYCVQCGTISRVNRQTDGGRVRREYVACEGITANQSFSHSFCFEQQRRGGAMTVSFGEISRVQIESRRADDAVLAFAKIEHGKPLTETDQQALAYARDFLEDVKRGSAWLSEKGQKTIDATSQRFFSPLVRAADSLTVGTGTLDTFKHEVDSLLQAAKRAADGDLINTEQIKSLRRFFNSVHTKSLDQVDAFFMPAPIPNSNVA